jgi:uncharacterized protein (DUF433 family)
MPIPGHPRIDARPSVCGGKPTILGTRIRIVDILEMFGGGMTEAEILSDFPQLTSEDVRGALIYAAEAHRHPVVLAAG